VIRIFLLVFQVIFSCVGTASAQLHCFMALLVVFCCATKYLPKSFHHALLLLFLHVDSCYSYCIACLWWATTPIVITLWCVGGLLQIVVCLLVPSTHHHHSPFCCWCCHVVNVVLHKSIWFFFFIYIAFSCENKKWPSLLKMKIGWKSFKVYHIGWKGWNHTKVKYIILS